MTLKDAVKFILMGVGILVMLLGITINMSTLVTESKDNYAKEHMAEYVEYSEAQIRDDFKDMKDIQTSSRSNIIAVYDEIISESEIGSKTYTESVAAVEKIKAYIKQEDMVEKRLKEIGYDVIFVRVEDKFVDVRTGKPGFSKAEITEKVNIIEDETGKSSEQMTIKSMSIESGEFYDY